ncbi:hypothetical protein BH11MYX1_BH11MYX1_27110 [soil metagenome]
MSEAPTAPRAAEGLRTRTIWFVGVAIVVVTLGATGIAWLFVRVPTVSPAAARPSSLEHGLVEPARGGTSSREAGARSLERYEWIDRGAGTVRIPIERAIEAAVADPSLIGGAR